MMRRHVKRLYKTGQSLPGGLERNGAKTPEIRTSRSSAQGFSASRRESSFSAPFPPPISHTEHDNGTFLGPFFFAFQRGLAKATALQRLPKRPQSVSEPRLSLIDRPLPSEGRIQTVYLLQRLADFLRAPCSRLHAIAKSNANPRDGRIARELAIHGQAIDWPLSTFRQEKLKSKDFAQATGVKRMADVA